MKKYAHGLSNYNDTDVINKETAIPYIMERETSFYEIYKKYVDFFPSNETSLSDDIYDLSILIGMNNPHDFEDYFKIYESSKKQNFYDSQFLYYVPDFSKWTVPNFYYQSRFTISGKNPRVIGPFTYLSFSSGLDKQLYYPFMDALIPIYTSILKNFEQVHIDEPAFSSTNIDLFDIKIISSFYEKLSKNTGTKINIFSFGKFPCYWMSDLNVNGIGMNFIDNSENFDYFDFKTDKTVFSGFINDNKLTKKQIEQIKKIDKKIDNLYICNSKALSKYKNYEKILENFNQLEGI